MNVLNNDHMECTSDVDNNDFDESCKLYFAVKVDWVNCTDTDEFPQEQLVFRAYKVGDSKVCFDNVII